MTEVDLDLFLTKIISVMTCHPGWLVGVGGGGALPLLQIPQVQSIPLMRSWYMDTFVTLSPVSGQSDNTGCKLLIKRSSSVGRYDFMWQNCPQTLF